MSDHKLKKRGNRYSRNPTGSPPHITEIDIARFQFLNVHGDLTGPYLHLYSNLQGLTRGEYTGTSTRKRLGKLYDWGWLDRHKKQYDNTRNTDRNYSVYRLNDKSKKLLRDMGLFIENTPRPSSSWKHDFMRSCYTASLHLHCLKNPDKFRFIPHHHIVMDIGKDIFKSIASGTDEFIPDALCGIQYVETGGSRLFMVEIDCGSEQNESTQRSRKTRKITVEDKLSAYRHYFRNKQHVSDFSRQGIMVPVVTVNPDRRQNIIDLLLKIKPSGANYILFTDVTCFGDFLYPPKDLLPVFNEPYHRANHEPFCINTP